MKNNPSVSLPTLILFAVTRGMLGAGIGLLLAGRLGDRRVRIGRTLIAIGALSTIPLARRMFRREAEEQYVDVSRFR